MGNDAKLFFKTLKYQQLKNYVNFLRKKLTNGHYSGILVFAVYD